jgi:asparagine synthetase B (glutamine-hydrolysing)
MFLFASDASSVSLHRTGRSAIVGRFPGELREVRANGAILLWTKDWFTVVERGSSEIAVHLRRLNIDLEPIVELRWRPTEGLVICRRRWSGEFCAYVSQQDGRKGIRQPETIITSHLKLAPLFLRKVVRRWQKIKPGYEMQLRSGRLSLNKQCSWAAPFRMDYSETVREVRRLVLESVALAPARSALLLSGGIDSSAVAAAMCVVGKAVHPFTFGLKKPVQPQQEWESDLACSRRVAAHLHLPMTEILLRPDVLVRNTPMGIYLAETSRGTIVDDCVALIEVAKKIAAAGYTEVFMGEAADDLFGSFKFALQYYRGQQLRAYYRAQLIRNLPDELAIIQNVFAWFGISVIQPLWTRELLSIGYNLPLHYRLDKGRLMKQVLRDAFAPDLPPEIVRRPKCVTRDSTQIRYVLENEFGTDRERYRALFRIMMGLRKQWPRRLHQLLKNCRS